MHNGQEYTAVNFQLTACQTSKAVIHRPSFTGSDSTMEAALANCVSSISSVSICFQEFPDKGGSVPEAHLLILQSKDKRESFGVHEADPG